MKKFSIIVLLLSLFFLAGCTVKVNTSATSSDYSNNLAQDTFLIDFDAKGVIRDLEKATEFLYYQQVDLTSTGLRDYFAQTLSFVEKQGDNQAHNTFNGTIYTFKGDGSCKTDGCYVTVNLYGEKGPNKKWTNANDPGDIFNIYFKVDNTGKIKVVVPEFIDYNW